MDGPSLPGASRQRAVCQWPLKMRHFWPSKMRHFWPSKMRHFRGRDAPLEASPAGSLPGRAATARTGPARRQCAAPSYGAPLSRVAILDPSRIPLRCRSGDRRSIQVRAGRAGGGRQPMRAGRGRYRENRPGAPAMCRAGDRRSIQVRPGRAGGGRQPMRAGLEPGAPAMCRAGPLPREPARRAGRGDALCFGSELAGTCSVRVGDQHDSAHPPPARPNRGFL